MARPVDKYHGILLLNKPSGITSHDAVIRVRRTVRQKSVGHAGTLDPEAEGLLVMCLGRATKMSQYLTNCDKSYLGEIHLGYESKTYDSEGVDPRATPMPVPSLNEKLIKRVFREFTGVITQKVPAYSAVRVDGKKLYKSARQGIPVDQPKRQVNIKCIDLIDFSEDRIRISVTCSKGTYIRSLAHDIGWRIGCGGYLSFLRRTQIGKMSLEDAITLEQVDEDSRNANLASHLLSINSVLEFGAITVRDDFRHKIANGVAPNTANIATTHGSFGQGDRVFIKDTGGEVLAVGMATVSSDSLGSQISGSVFEFDRVLI